MANEYDNKFTEVIDLSVNVAAFKKSLEEAEAAWTDFKKKFGDTGTSTLSAGVSSEVKKLGKELKDLATLTLQIQKDLADKLDSITKESVSNEEKATKQKLQGKKKAADEELKITKQKLQEETKAEQTAKKLTKLARDINIEQEGVVNKFDAEVEKNSIKETEAAFKRVLRLHEIDKLQIKHARETANTIEGIENQHTANLEKAFKRILTLHEQDTIAAQRSVKALTDKTNAMFKLADAQREAARTLNTEQEGIANRTLAERVKLERQLAETTRLTGVSDAKAYISGLPKPEQLRELVNLYRLMAQSIAQLKLSQDALRNSSDVDAIAERKRLQSQILKESVEQRGVLTQINTLQSQLGKAAETHNGFVERITGGWAGTAAHLVKVVVIFQAINAAAALFKALVFTPFQMIADGVKYLRELERSADDMTGLLAKTAEFSKDPAENFERAARAAVAISEELRKVAALTGQSEDTVERVFKGFQGAGALQYVKNMREVVDLSQMFIVLLKSSEKGSLAVNEQIGQLNQLLNGTVNANNILLKQLGLSPGEWQKILEKAGKHKTLVSDLAGLYKPFADQVAAAGKGQAVLLTQVEAMIKKLEGMASKELFEDVNKFLITLKDTFEKNGPAISSALTLTADAIRLVVGALKTMQEQMGIFDILLFTLKSIYFVVLTLVDSFSYLAVTVSSASKIMRTAMVGDLAGMKQAMSEWLEFSKKTAKQVKEQSDVLFGGKLIVQPGSGVLDQNVNAKGGKPDPDPANFAIIRAQLDARLADVDKSIGDVERKYAELNDVLQESLSAQVITYRQASLQIEENARRENAELQVLYDKKRKLITEAANLAAQESDKDTKRAEVESIRLKTTLARLEEQIQDKERVRDKAVSNARRQALREEVNLRKLDNEQQRQLIEEQLNTELSIVREKASQKLLTAVDVFNKEEELEKTNLENQKARLEEQISAIVVGHEARKKLENELALLLVKGDNAQKQRDLRRIDVVRQETLARQRLNIEVQNAELDSQEQQISKLGLITPNVDLFRQIDELLEKRRELINQQIDFAEAQVAQAQADGKSADEIARLTLEVTKLFAAREALFGQRIDNINTRVSNPILAGILRSQAARIQATTSAGVGLRPSDVINTLLGSGTVEAVKRAFSSTATTMDKFGAVTAVATGALSVFGNILGAFKQGKESGGLLGGIGAVGAQFGAIPVIGPYVQAISGALSFIGQLFVNSAKKTAEEVKKNFQRIMDSYSAGNTTLVDTISQLEAARVDAITRLSGKKNGKTELEKILPDIEKEIANLKRQQRDLIDSFESQLDGLRMQSDSLAQIRQQWVEINKQVRDYLNAGGDANKAAEYLSLSLDKIKQQAIEELEGAEQEAIQAVLRLNDLLKQRNQLIEDFKKKEFDLINASALERRLPGSLARGKELEQLRREHLEQLANLESEISGAQRRVDKEAQIFTLTNETATLRRRDEELTLLALDRQLARIMEMKNLVAGMFTGPNGFTQGSGVLGPISINVNVTGGGVTSPTDLGTAIGESISAELSRRMRMLPA